MPRVAPQPLVIVAYGATSTTCYPLPLTGTVTIGREDGNDIRLDDAAVSRRHARLHLNPGIRIEDAGSANGIRILAHHRPSPGTARLQETRLTPGESQTIAIGVGIAIGSTLLVVQPKDQDGAPLSSRKPRSGVDPIVRSPAMREIYEQVDRIARGAISVLLLGESGVGKEVMADAIHRRSRRAAKPFLCLNCAAFSEALLESELFGGAGKAKPGLLEMADGGTVFLEDVGELPLRLQGKLLRVLEERQVPGVGGLKHRSIDVRFIAATNRDLGIDIAQGAFRQDLFNQLSGITLVIPPLRERVSEIEPLARSFILTICEQLGRGSAPELSLDAIGALQRYHWPANVQELRNVMERAVMLSDGAMIAPEHLGIQGGFMASFPSRPSTVVDGLPILRSDRPSGVSPIASRHIETRRTSKTAQEDERARIVAALDRCAGNQTRAAAMLGVSRRTLIHRLDEYGLSRPRKKG